MSMFGSDKMKLVKNEGSGSDFGWIGKGVEVIGDVIFQNIWKCIYEIILDVRESKNINDVKIYYFFLIIFSIFILY